MNKFKIFWHQLDPHFKRNLFWIFIAYFFVLASYPFVRSSAQAIFLEHYTASEIPLVWFWSIITLTGLVWLSSRLQHQLGVRRLFALHGFASIVIICFCLFGLTLGFKLSALILSIWKEVYIIFLVHLIIGFCNAYFKISEIKNLFGFIAAAGSLGGIIGGLLTAQIADIWGTDAILYGSVLIILLSVLSFLKTDSTIHLGEEDHRIKAPPLESLKQIKKYVLLTAAIVALSQFVINIADLQFNLAFEQIIETKDQRSSYLGRFYSLINGVTLLFSLFVLPYVLNKFSSKTMHIMIPTAYLLLCVLGSTIGNSFLFVIASVFILLKASDYSLFSMSKELLYQPLNKEQKFGAKYVTDMFIYRCAKAVLALGLLSYQSSQLLIVLQVIFIIIWICLVILLFREQKRISS
jgi:ATP:ADP antiporter, AAA family